MKISANPLRPMILAGGDEQVVANNAPSIYMLLSKEATL
jgi:hypothetical protein